jgi:hypothetical protein
MINNPINHLRNFFLEHSVRSVLRAIIHHDDLSAPKGDFANRLDDLFDRVLLVVTGDYN